MIKLKINNLEVQAEEYWTILEAAKFYGIEIPTLCYREGLTPYGACRLCVVEIGPAGRSKLVSSCTYPVQEGLEVRTDSERVIRARKMLLELYVASSPQSKTIQDLANKYGVTKVRFKREHEDCILCGLCVRMCQEQMQGKAIGFAGRGKNRRITTPFDMKSDECRLCGGCMYVCPLIQVRCDDPSAEHMRCGACATFTPTCLESYPDKMCYLPNCAGCVPVPDKKEEKVSKE
jgi:NADH dehydrogenase/NADH:ubiquinone oxidoreductase subunit G